MTRDVKILAAEAFEEAVAAVLRAHRRHATVLGEGRPQDAPRSRRTLYNALKNYRRLETAFYHASITGNLAEAAEKIKNENHSPEIVENSSVQDGCHNNDV